MQFVDLNGDVGESFGRYRIGYDEEVLKHATSANIGCGFHAGDPLIMGAGTGFIGAGWHPLISLFL
jgi:Uncharacterized proteins, homologs of lactam utilization protein B